MVLHTASTGCSGVPAAYGESPVAICSTNTPSVRSTPPRKAQPMPRRWVRTNPRNRSAWSAAIAPDTMKNTYEKKNCFWVPCSHASVEGKYL